VALLDFQGGPFRGSCEDPLQALGSRRLSAHSHSHVHPGERLRWLRVVDTLGIWLSAACVVHCAATPLLIALLPLVSTHEFEGFARLGLASLGLVGVGIGALLHKNLKALPLLGVAFVLFMGLAVAEHWTHFHHSARLEFALSALGSFALMGAHALNSKACRDSEHECAPGRWFADGLWGSRSRTESRFWIALLFAGGLHVFGLGFALQ
jgi:hypothetical protein